MFKLIPIMFVSVLSACALAPGMDMNTDNGLSEIEFPTMKDGHLVKEKARIVPITADLIMEREAAR
ncbi:MAG: sugar transporter, partial [Methylicorpusculum sp.]|nr:sugar transporter [Methylicorpusculum sp.]